MSKDKSERRPAVWIRKSSDVQDEFAQRENVKRQLTELGVTVAESDWFVVTVSRSKVRSSPQFRQLMALVE